MFRYRGLRAWVCAVLLLGNLAACSRGPESPPAGLAGLRFGDAPGPGLTAIRVPLPEALAAVLSYRARPGPAGDFHGQALTDPVFVFLRERLFSVLALLADPAGEAALARDLETAYGPAMSRRGVGGLSRLWRLDGVDVVLEHDPSGRPRLLVRSREPARELAGWREQDLALERESGGP